MDTMFWVWLAVIVGTVIIECITMDLVSIWFTFGAVIPFILAGTRVVGWEIQLIIFIVLSAAMIIGLRKITKKWLFKNSSKEHLNTVVGMKVKMIENADEDNLGTIKINDVVWSAKSEDGTPLSKGEMVEIVKISGNKAIVKKIYKEKE